MKHKAKCHICANKMKTPQDQQPPCFCDTCGANLVNPGDETQLLFTAVEKEAGGVMAELVYIYLTNKRIIFIPDEDTSTASVVGGVVGGVIGAAVAGAIAGAVAAEKKKHIVSVPRADFVSFGEEPAGLLKNKIRLTINTNSGNAFGMTMSKKEAAKWKTAMSQPPT